MTERIIVDSNGRKHITNEPLLHKPAPGSAHYEDGDVFERISAMKKQPAQRTWVGLTDEEILIMSRYDLEYAALIGEVQRKLKEKNSD